MLDQPYMTDLIEANSMGHEPHKIHIYSASWGPTDDGRTVDGPRNATMRAIVRGVNEVSEEPAENAIWSRSIRQVRTFQIPAVNHSAKLAAHQRSFRDIADIIRLTLAISCEDAFQELNTADVTLN